MATGWLHKEEATEEKKERFRFKLVLRAKKIKNPFSTASGESSGLSVKGPGWPSVVWGGALE